MWFRIVILGASLAAGILAASVASAGGHCGGTGAGMTTPCGESGCGPRSWGPWHGPCDPCDACGRWAGCNGGRQAPERLPPWQLPPGRGFRPPAALGYERPIGVCGAGAPCATCRSCEPRHGRDWLRPATLF